MLCHHSDVIRMCFSGRAAGFDPDLFAMKDKWKSIQPKIWTQELISSVQPSHGRNLDVLESGQAEGPKATHQ